MKKIHLVFVFAILFSGKIFAQDQSPITEIFYGPVLIDNQTTTSPTKKQKIFQILHRFSDIKEISDLYGIYGASNVRVGMDYGITDKLMVGFGTEKYSKMQEFRYKYAILQQTPGKMPVSISYFGNTVIQGGKKEAFGTNYKFLDRLSFFHQLIIARQITKGIAVQIAPSYSHFNKVDTSTVQFDAFGINVGAQIKIHNDISFVCEYNQGFWINSTEHSQVAPKPSIALGIQIGTGTHAFQIFVTSFDQIIPQKSYTFNQNDFTDSNKRGIMLGFNLSARL
jgi:hypothetical protein